MRYDGSVTKVGLCLVALAGCSFATMQSPHGSPPECETSQGAPAFDTLLAIASPFLVYWAVSSSTSQPSDSTDALGKELADGLVTTLISAPVIAVLGGSAVYGFVKADRCTRAKRDYAQLMAAPPGMPGQYVPPPVMPGPTGAPPPQAPLPMVPPGPAPAPIPTNPR